MGGLHRVVECKTIQRTPSPCFPEQSHGPWRGSVGRRVATTSNAYAGKNNVCVCVYSYMVCVYAQLLLLRYGRRTALSIHRRSRRNSDAALGQPAARS